MARLEQLDETYRQHHETRRSPDFVFGGAERAALFRDVGRRPGRRVLDLGCRYGALTRAYAEGNDVVGIDVDREALAEAAKLGIETRLGDVDRAAAVPGRELRRRRRGELLEHLPLPGRTVAEARRVLRPGGFFVGSVPNAYRAAEPAGVPARPAAGDRSDAPADVLAGRDPGAARRVRAPELRFVVGPVRPALRRGCSPNVMRLQGAEAAR